MKSRTVHLLTVLFFLTAAVLLSSLAWAASNKRAKPPRFKKSESDIFFSDAREKLVGARPAQGSGVASSAPGAPSGGGPSAPDAGGSFAWSKIIAPETIEDEIKNLQKQIAATVQAQPPFQSGGYKDARREFTELAVLFGVAAEYDGDVRWKQQAAGARDLIARVGHNCKVATDASYKEAKARRDDMEKLVRGEKIDAAGGDAKAKWDKVADRPPLMQRLEELQQKGLQVYTSNAADFAKSADKALAEAQLLAMIAEVIQHDDFEFANDETYIALAKTMRDQSMQVAEAAKAKNYDMARKAVGEIGQACSKCHEGYR